MKTSSDPRDWYRQEEQARERARFKMQDGKGGSLTPMYVAAALVGARRALPAPRHRRSAAAGLALNCALSPRFEFLGQAEPHAVELRILVPIRLLARIDHNIKQLIRTLTLIPHD